MLDDRQQSPKRKQGFRQKDTRLRESNERPTGRAGAASLLSSKVTLTKPWLAPRALLDRRFEGNALRSNLQPQSEIILA